MLTGVFGVYGAIAVLMAFACVYFSLRSYWGFNTLIGMLYPILVWPALYCDWVLALIGNNLIGMPDSDAFVLYFVYLAVKLLPMLTW